MEKPKKRKERAKLSFEILDPLYTYEKTALAFRSPLERVPAGPSAGQARVLPDPGDSGS